MCSKQFAISSEIFQSEYFEKKFVYLPKVIPHISYTWDDFSRDLYSIDPGDRRTRLFENGEVSKEQYTLLVQDGQQVRALYKPGHIEKRIKNGATLVVNNFEKTSAYVAEICQMYVELSGHRCSGNAYVANGGSGTFGKHWDTHCVFATQLLGEKLWRIYKPTHELPLQFQTSKDVKEECGDIPVFEKVLEPGDILYIPRGWWHEAIPLDGVPTLHIAAGIYSTKIFEYLRWIVESQMPKYLEARISIDSDIDMDLLKGAVKVLEREVLSSGNTDEFVRTHLQTVKNQHPICFKEIFRSQKTS